MKLFEKLFGDRKKRTETERSGFAPDGLQVQPLPDSKKGTYEDYLFGDFNEPGMHAVLPEFVLDRELTGFYKHIDEKLAVIFANGVNERLDAFNGNFYDIRIEYLGKRALQSALSRYAWIIEQPVQIAVSARAHDITRLSVRDEEIQKELDEIDAELALLREKEESVNNFKPKRRDA